MIIDVVRNMVNFAPDGYEPFQLKAEHPMSQFNDFDRRLTGDAARNLNMPLNIAAADSSKYNYASGRLDHQLWWRTQDIERSELEADVLTKIVDLWVFFATRIDDYLPMEARLLDTDWAHTWHYDSRQHVDPKKEADAQKVRLENGTTTLAAELTTSGEGWRATMDQQKIENDYAVNIGIPKPHALGEVTGQVIATPEDIVDVPVIEETDEPDVTIPDDIPQEVETLPEITLNGAQISSATTIVSQVAEGLIGREAGLGMLEVLLNLSPEQALRVMGETGNEEIVNENEPATA